MRKICVLALLVAVVLSANQSTFCWKDSYGRGVGIIPDVCPSDQDKLGLLCYKKCPAGFNRPAGLDCYSTCPSGFTDTGLYCMINSATYGRGAGYPWKFGDWFNDDGMFSRCEADNGKGNCEKYGLIVYPKCKPGYTNSGCCICAANFNCNSFGFWSNVQTAYSCFKNRVAVGDASSPSCPSGYENQAGLCYKKCNAGYYGVGPVCWANIPSGWVDCGMGAATTSLTCASTVFSQVSSVFMLAANLATFGTTGEATAALKASDPKYIQKIKDLLAKVKNVYDKNQDVVNYFKGLAAAGSGAITAKNFINLMGMDNAQPEDIVRIIAEVISLFDPTGVSSVVAAYTYPMCSKMK